MISFLLCLALLIVGYFVYGKIVDNTFGPDDRETPAVRINDGVEMCIRDRSSCGCISGRAVPLKLWTLCCGRATT